MANSFIKNTWKWMCSLYDYFYSLFWASQLEITLVGLQNAGKTSLLHALMGKQFTFESIPTVGFTVKRVKVGNVTLKCSDLGGQVRFRPLWERGCFDANAILFLVDSADPHTISASKQELHVLSDLDTLYDIPILVLANKNDLPEASTLEDVQKALDISTIKHHQVTCYSISVKDGNNMDAVLNWLLSNDLEKVKRESTSKSNRSTLYQFLSLFERVKRK